MIVAIDTEVTTFNKGNPFDKRNHLVCISYWSDKCNGCVFPEDGDSYREIQSIIDSATLIVGFNFKFDLHWLKKCGFNLEDKRIWDCQLAEFILSSQTIKYPSLDGTCTKYGLPNKLDVIKLEYWDKGVNTDEIPREILQEYALKDAELTLEVYKKQQLLVSPKQKKLISLGCQDLPILAEMESNGILLDVVKCKTESLKLDDRISEISKTLQQIYPNIPINWNSGDHVSAFLYGGIIKETTKVLDGFYKTGKKAGEPKYRNQEIEHTLPKLYTPLKGSELKKEGFYATNEDTLKKLKGNKKWVNLLLELSKLEKLNGTYYKGLPNKIEEMYWEDNYLHGQFNQCVAGTGRLASSNPNLQNFASDLQDIFITRII
jgi:DNA polymerase-1